MFHAEPPYGDEATVVTLNSRALLRCLELRPLVHTTPNPCRLFSASVRVHDNGRGKGLGNLRLLGLSRAHFRGCRPPYTVCVAIIIPVYITIYRKEILLWIGSAPRKFAVGSDDIIKFALRLRTESVAYQSIDCCQTPLLVSLKMGSGSRVIFLILFHWSMLHSGIKGLKLAAYNVRNFGPKKVVAMNMISEV